MGKGGDLLGNVHTRANVLLELEPGRGVRRRTWVALRPRCQRQKRRQGEQYVCMYVCVRACFFFFFFRVFVLFVCDVMRESFDGWMAREFRVLKHVNMHAPRICIYTIMN